MEHKVMINNMTAEERAALMAELQEADKQEKINRREAYEGIRNAMLQEAQQRLETVVEDVKAFKDWLEKELAGFRAVMAEYGQLKNDDQAGFTLCVGNFKLVVKSNKVKKFDERADLAASRLIAYLNDFVASSDKGGDDPMYQLAMTLLERNKQGDLDYKSVSKLYDLEAKFDEVYKEIMDLFRESNVVMTQATNYYFYRRDNDGVWRQLEPSFCRL